MQCVANVCGGGTPCECPGVLFSQVGRVCGGRGAVREDAGRVCPARPGKPSGGSVSSSCGSRFSLAPSLVASMLRPQRVRCKINLASVRTGRGRCVPVSWSPHNVLKLACGLTCVACCQVSCNHLSIGGAAPCPAARSIPAVAFSVRKIVQPALGWPLRLCDTSAPARRQQEAPVRHAGCCRLLQHGLGEPASTAGRSLWNRLADDGDKMPERSIGRLPALRSTLSQPAAAHAIDDRARLSGRAPCAH